MGSSMGNISNVVQQQAGQVMLVFSPAPEWDEGGKNPVRLGKSAEMPVWYYNLNGQTLGPVLEEEIRNWLKSGQINSDTYLWKEGLEGWITLASAGLADNAPREEDPNGGDICPALRQTG